MGCSGVGNQGAAGSAGASSCQQGGEGGGDAGRAGGGEGGGGGSLSFDQAMRLVKKILKHQQSEGCGKSGQDETSQVDLKAAYRTSRPQGT